MSLEQDIAELITSSDKLTQVIEDKIKLFSNHLEASNPHAQYAQQQHSHEWKDLNNTPQQHNRVINGCMRVWQRGQGAITDFSDLETFPFKHYTGPDRYITNGQTAGNSTQGRFESSYEAYGNKHWLKNQCHTPANGTDYIARAAVYLFEDKDIEDLIGEEVNLSFLFRASTKGQYSLAVGYPNDRRFTIFSFQYDPKEDIKSQDFTFRLPEDLFTSTSKGSPKRSGRGLEVYFFYGVDDANPLMSDESNLDGTFTQVDEQETLTRKSDHKWWLNAGDWVAITEFKLEKGTVNSTFFYRPLAQELWFCQRYFEISYTPNQTISPQGQQLYTASGTTSEQHTQRFKVSKRSPPSVILYSPQTGQKGKVDREFAIAPAQEATASNISEHAFSITLTGLSQDQSRYSYHFAADAELA